MVDISKTKKFQQNQIDILETARQESANWAQAEQTLTGRFEQVRGRVVEMGTELGVNVK